jgi:NTE family protein
MQTPKYDLVLGAGGIKGYAHIGVLRAIEKLGIEIDVVTGVSVGAGVAAFYSNGHGPDAILDAFKAGRARMFDPALWASALKIPNPFQWLITQSFVSLEGPWRDQVIRYGLKANDRLQILAHDAVHAKPVLFKGKDYCLDTAIAASGSVPGSGGFLPVQHGTGQLVDGAVYHYNPTTFSKAPAIVVVLGRAKRFPMYPMHPLDAWYTGREIYAPMIATHNDVDGNAHIVVYIPCEDVAGLAMGTPEARCLKLVDEAEAVALETLNAAIKAGKIVPKRSPANVGK